MAVKSEPATHRIADLYVSMHPAAQPLLAQAAAYQLSESEPCCADINIDLDHEQIAALQKRNPHLSWGECEYMQSGSSFYRQLLRYHGCMLHASAVALGDRAYLFSAPCGTGKSTHASLWKQHFADAVILNDDKPAIRLTECGADVFGTPWSGKTDLNLNQKAALKAICFIEQSKDNWIRPLETSRAVQLFLSQTVRPKDRTQMELLLSICDRLFSCVRVFHMGCRIDEAAVTMAYEAMRM